MKIRTCLLVGVIVLCALAPFRVSAQEVYPASNEDEAGVAVGARPYEMDWAGRTEPNHPQLADFEDLDGWRVRCFDGADARLYRSRQELLFGEYTAKVVYSGETARSRFIIEPPEPIAIPAAFTGVNVWLRGNNWGFINPPATARVSINVLVRDAKDEEYRINVGVNDFDYWCLLHCTCVSPDGRARHYERVDDGGDDAIDFPARFVGIEVTGVSNKHPARLHFDALCLYEMKYEPLAFEPIPEDLPWPTTPDTILPIVTNTAEQVAFSYKPGDGSLGDLAVEAGGQRFRPCWKGGIVFELDGKSVRPGDPDVKTEFLGEGTDGGKRVYDWALTAGGTTVRYRYAIEVKNKSCIVDVAADGGHATRFDVGLARGLHEPKAVYIPYLTYGDDWPRVVCSTRPEGRVFLLAVLDYYNSDASELFGAPRLRDEGGLAYAGGSVYNPTTAGKRNPVRERLFINVGSDVHEVLPNIPNPKCDTGDLARECLWCNIGQAFQHERLGKYKAYGIDHFIACHHEVGWREAGESFTMRDRPAPSIGEAELAEYGAWVKGLGYRFGTYTNYVDFPPVNANWNEDDVCLDPEGRWQRAWPRCYALKPLRAAEKEAYYAPRIHERYGTTAQYCDVHTAYAPWGRTDYDARTPGAAMFRTQFNAFARLLWNESTAHHGPVFSEGNHHWFYAGIVDGNYATMLPYGGGWRVPHIVDFDLLKMHTKMTDFGMGYGNMYFGRDGDWTEDQSVHSPWFDRFITATVAFGHIGFLSYEWGFEGTLKSYYMHQALQKRYAMTPVKAIRYFDGTQLVDTSTAIATDAYKRSQVFVEYEGGLKVWCNLSFDDNWSVAFDGQAFDLPPASFVAHKPGDILAYSAAVDGQRHEVVQCPDYVYLDSRGEIVRTPAITARGCVAVKPDGANAWWIIPATECEEVSIAHDWLGAGREVTFAATAHNLAGEEVGAAVVLQGVDEVTVLPSDDEAVVKYRLTATAKPGDVPSVRRLDLPGRALMQGTSMPVTVSVTPPADTSAPAGEVVWAFGRPGSADLASGRAKLSRVGDALEATATLSFEMPQNAPLHERCWYRTWSEWASGVKGAARWVDITAVPAFDLSFPTAAVRARAAEPFNLATQVKTNAAAPVDAALRFEAAAVLDEPLEKELHLVPGTVETVVWPLELPHGPVATEVKLRAEAGGHATEAVRYLETTPAEWVVADLTKTPYQAGQCLRGEDEAGYDSAGTLALVALTKETVAGERLDSVYMHPPYKGGVGYVFATFDVSLPQGRPKLAFALGFRSGSSSQDGAVFKVVVLHQGRDTEVFSEHYANLDAWARRSADLTPFAGQDVSLKLIVDVGPEDNSYSDWAAWGAPRIVMDDPAVEVKCHADRPAPRFLPAPEPLPGLSFGDLGTVVSAEVTLEAAGVDGGTYASYVYFNGIRIGATPESKGDTAWHPAEVPLTKEALATIGAMNTVVIKNPGRDYMKVRALCLRFELADGRRGSSWIDQGPYCSASGWEFDEGTSVPVGSDLPQMMLNIPVTK